MAAKRMPNEKDYITNKVLIVFTACLGGVLGLMFLYKLLDSASGFMAGYIAVQALGVIGIVGVIAGFIRMYIEKRDAADTNCRLVTGRNVVMVFAVVALSMGLILSYDAYRAIKVLYVILPAIAVYYLIFHSYQREFFVISVDAGIGAAFMWILGQAQNSGSKQWIAYAVVALAVVLTVAQIVWTVFLQKNAGKMKSGKEKNAIFTAACNYLLMHVSAVLMVALLAAGLILGAHVAYYLTFVIFAYLFVLTVYYTVKLM